jgi:hypothetical protein
MAPLVWAVNPDLAHVLVDNDRVCVLDNWFLAVKFAPLGPRRPIWRAARVPSIVILFLGVEVPVMSPKITIKMLHKAIEGWLKRKLQREDG